MNPNNLFATVDLGSNSFRLLIAKIDDDGILHPIDKIKEMVRLTGGLDDDGNLTQEVQLSALAVLSRFSERLVGFTKNQVRVVGTSAFRVARNSRDFVAIASKTLGFNIEIISGTEEARLLYIGAVHSLAYTLDKRLIIDIGGGSTEFVIGSGYDPQIMESVTMGCVSFSDRYFIDGVLTDENFNHAIYAARSKTQAMRHLFANHAWEHAIGTSGTAKSLYELCIANNFGDSITLDGLYKLKKLLIKHKNSKYLTLNGLKEERRRVVAGGLSIMIAIMEDLDISTMTVADGALREGLMYDLLGRKTDHDLRISTVHSLEIRYAIDVVQSDRVASTACYLCTSLIDEYDAKINYLKLLHWAAQLYEIGLSISHNDYHRHGAYILANADLAGFSRPEQSILADLVRTHRGGLVKAVDSVSMNRKLKLPFLMLILSFRFAVIFNRNRKTLPNAVVSEIRLADDKTISMLVDHEWLAHNPLTLYSLNEEIKEWQKLNFTIILGGNNTKH